MNEHSCCRPPVYGQGPPGTAKRATFLRRCLKFIRCIIPGFVLLIIPKCPLCVAAYISLGTGIGISMAAAAWIRWTLIAFCLASFLYLAARLYLRKS